MTDQGRAVYETHEAAATELETPAYILSVMIRDAKEVKAWAEARQTKITQGNPGHGQPTTAVAQLSRVVIEHDDEDRSLLAVALDLLRARLNRDGECQASVLIISRADERLRTLLTGYVVKVDRFGTEQPALTFFDGVSVAIEDIVELAL